LKQEGHVAVDGKLKGLTTVDDDDEAAATRAKVSTGGLAVY